jgi:hypothetical protein
MISRITVFPTYRSRSPAPTSEARPFVAQKSDNRSQSAQGQVPTQPGRHDEIGASPFLGIRHLLFQNGSQANRCHAGAPQHPLALHQGRCRHHEDIITPAIAAGFKQQRNIQHGKRLAPGAGVIEKPLLSGGDHRMKDLLQPLERSRIPEYPLPEKSPIDPPGCGLNARKSA